MQQPPNLDKTSQLTQEYGSYSALCFVNTFVFLNHFRISPTVSVYSELIYNIKHVEMITSDFSESECRNETLNNVLALCELV